MPTPWQKLRSIITTPINRDTVSEPDNLFIVTLFNAINATIVDDVAAITIINDDSP